MWIDETGFSAKTNVISRVAFVNFSNGITLMKMLQLLLCQKIWCLLNAFKNTPFLTCETKLDFRFR